MELVEDVNAQLKAEVEGAEITKAQRFALQQKYGLSAVLDTDIEWYLSFGLSAVDTDIEWYLSFDAFEVRSGR